MAATPDVRPVGDLPDSIGKTAARELSLHRITTLETVAAQSKKELLAIHGVGPKAVAILGEALKGKGLTYRGMSSVSADENKRLMQDETAIIELLDRVTTAYRERDPDAVVAADAPDAEVYDLAPPLRQRRSRDDVAAWLEGWHGPVEDRPRAFLGAVLHGWQLPGRDRSGTLRFPDLGSIIISQSESLLASSTGPQKEADMNQSIRSTRRRARRCAPPAGPAVDDPGEAGLRSHAEGNRRCMLTGGGANLMTVLCCGNIVQTEEVCASSGMKGRIGGTL